MAWLLSVAMWLEITDKVELDSFLQVPSRTMKDGVYKLDGLQLVFCDFYTFGYTDGSKKIAFPCLSSWIQYGIWCLLSAAYLIHLLTWFYCSKMSEWCFSVLHIWCDFFFFPSANLTGHAEKVGIENFELLKVLGTGGKMHYF